MRIDLFPCVVRANKKRQSELRRLRQAEIQSRHHVPMWKRWFRRAG